MTRHAPDTAVAVALPVVASAQTAPPPPAQATDPTGDAQPVACVDGPGGFECSPNGSNVPKADLTRATATSPDSITVTMDVDGPPVADSDDGYVAYFANVRNHPNSQDATVTITLNVFDDGSTVKTIVDGTVTQNDPDCRDATFDIQQLQTGGTISFEIPTSCREAVGGTPAAWVDVCSPNGPPPATLPPPTASTPRSARSSTPQRQAASPAPTSSRPPWPCRRHSSPTAPTPSTSHGRSTRSLTPSPGGMVADGPIILVPADATLPTSVASYLADLPDTTQLVALGGTSAITDTVLGYATQAAIGGR